MTDCKYWKNSWGKSFAGRCFAPDDVKTSAVNKWCKTPQTCPYLSEPELKMDTKESIQKQIEELQRALKQLEYDESKRDPWEKAYRNHYGHFPVTGMGCNDWDAVTIQAFTNGWASGITHTRTEEEMVRENLKTSLKELAKGDVRPIDDVMTEAKTLQEIDWEVDVKTNLNPHWTPNLNPYWKPKNSKLHQICQEWCETDMASISSLVDKIRRFFIDNSEILYDDDTITFKIRKELIE